ncbi:hypothetical protein BaRGS_00026865 [Batillaria attramentaria]|uniref:RING-type E3 ubiquitin transferase n=1 Tax=Batillaria attramentaria TaxID=370345 RepID=A0ABD0K3K9_9CAEN
MSEALSSRKAPNQCETLAVKLRLPVTMAQPPSLDTSFGQTSSPNVSLSAYEMSSGSDGSYPFTGKVVGYDYEFVPPVDGRYECTICFGVLREPRQTPCGHRFCRDCILKWLRQPQHRCPVDNEHLSDSMLFPDNFAKREIDNFTAKCPNSKQGCDVIETVKRMPSHLKECPLAFVPCPNNCASVLIRRDLADHMHEHCQNRLVHCPDCGQQGKAADFEEHVQSCPHGKVKCEHCGEEVARREIERHRKDFCQKTNIPCMFQALGCEVQVQRDQLDKHIRESLTPHLSMLCQGMVAIMQRIGINRLSTEGVPLSARELTPTEISGFMSSLVQPLQQLSLETRQPQGAPGDSRSLDSSSVVKTSVSMHRSPSDPKYSMLISSGTQEASGFSHTSGASDYGVKMAPASLVGPVSGVESESLKSLHHDEMLVRHKQSLLELQAKTETLERNLKQKMKQYDQQISELEGKMCNGQYYWRIRNYSRYQREAEHGQTTALHSHPFYTSPYGYKLCIRANLNGVDSAKGSHLSLFIHFMQGENDDLLEWPFNGRIVLSVKDQNECCELRNHVAETLSSKPNLAAFQRPTTPRNHKGFGYMEFLPLNVLRNSSYIRNDTLIIKAHVLPNG